MGLKRLLQKYGRPLKRKENSRKEKEDRHDAAAQFVKAYRGHGLILTAKERFMLGLSRLSGGSK